VIEVTDLSGDIELESFRVSGLGAARLLVATCYSDDHPDIPTSDPIRDLQSQLRELTDEREALETEIAILKGFGKNMANMPGLTPDNATSFSSTLFEKTLSNATAVRELDAKITELDRQIEKLEDAKSGTADVRAVVTIVADDAGPAQLRLTYREFSIQAPQDIVSTFSLLGVDEASWRPLYDLYAYSQDGKPSTSVSLHYRVNLSQSTGEDWNDAKLILSTSETDVLNAGVPTSDGLIVEPKPKSLPPSPPSPKGGVRIRLGASRYMDVKAEAYSEESEEFEDADLIDGSPSLLACALPDMSESGAIISKSPMAVSYTVDELTTILSDNESHKVLVATVPFEASISHITTPRKSPLAYLQVRPPPVLINRLTHYPMVYSAQ